MLHEFLGNLDTKLETLRRHHPDNYAKLMADVAEALEKFDRELQSTLPL